MQAKLLEKNVHNILNTMPLNTTQMRPWRKKEISGCAEISCEKHFIAVDHERCLDLPQSTDIPPLKRL